MKELSAPKQVSEGKADGVKVKLLLASPLHCSPPHCPSYPWGEACGHKGCATQTQPRLGIQSRVWRNGIGKGVSHPTRSGFKPHPGSSARQRAVPTEGHSVSPSG